MSETSLVEVGVNTGGRFKKRGNDTSVKEVVKMSVKVNELGKVVCVQRHQKRPSE